MFDENFLPLSPANFFEIKLTFKSLNGEKWKEEITKKKYLLPESGWLLGEKDSPPLHFAWSSEGLYGYLEVEGRFEDPSFPEIQSGDSLEIFVDTRDRKNSGANTKFCHHFYFFPQAIEGHIKGERTHFRTEDAHPLCDAEDLYLEAHGSARSGKLKFHIPATCLTGWNPLEFNRIGFSYRLNRRWYETRHFSAKTAEFNVEQDPALWASCTLSK